MSVFSARLGLALVLAALCLDGRTAHAQAAPVRYWVPSWPFGFGSNLTVGQNSNTYSNFPSFDGDGGQGGGFSHMRYNFSNGWFVGGDGGGMGWSKNGINEDGAFNNIPSLYYEGVQFGYNLQNTAGLPLTVYAGFDTLKYSAGNGGLFAPFESLSSTIPGYGAHAGVEFRPVPDVSLSLGFGYSQQSGLIDSDINSLSLPGASPFAFTGRR